MQRRTVLSAAAVMAAGVTHAPAAQANLNLFGQNGPSVVVLWNRALLGAIAATATQATIAARAISMVHEAIYNAWAAYDLIASFTLPGIGRRPFWEFSPDTKRIAISHAAYLVLVDLFPTQKSVFDDALSANAGGLVSILLNGLIAKTVGQTVGNALLQSRHGDGSNQLGDLHPGAYSDYTGYVPVNTPDLIVDINRWQPLRVPTADGSGTLVQRYLTPHWGRVKPFALAAGAEFRPVMQHLAPTQAEMQQLIDFSAGLNDNTKALVDFWAANPGTVSPPGQWMQFAEQVSDADNNSLDEDVKLLFGAAQAVLDAGIAAWDVKRVYDSVRPITAIPYYFRNQTLTAWGGPGRGTQLILGQNWRPFQRPTNPTPPFPEFVSGHSTFSASAATVLAGLRGSDVVTLTGIIAARSLKVDPGYPTVDVNFVFNRLSDAANSAGLSRRVGGIHFEQGDLGGRALGKQVGNKVLARCQGLFRGLRV